MNETIYFDNNATSALNPKVLETMMPFLQYQVGNPTSQHSYGRHARLAIDTARQQVAESCGCHPSQVIFTSGGTESDNLAIQGISAGFDTSSQIVVSAIEHPAVTRPAFSLRSRGYRVAVIGTDKQGFIDPLSLEVILEKPTALISAMMVNNETGVIQDIKTLNQLAKTKGVLFHTDAVQALGKIEVNFEDLEVDALSISAHKINGPQGVGALIVSKSIDIFPLLNGGGQERGLRSGTENVAGIVGFGQACALLKDQADIKNQTVAMLRDQLETGLLKLKATIFAHHSTRVANTSFFAFNHIQGETLVTAMDQAGFAIASGSACSSDSTEPSHVLMAMGVASDLARGAVRVSLSINNTAEQIQTFLVKLEQVIGQFSNLSAVKITA
jgi:cysteine desulfurase